MQSHLIEAEVPTHNIICFHGQGGIGKSTLLTRLRDMEQQGEQRHALLFGFVNEKQASPDEVIQSFARSLKLSGAFDKALELYKDTLRKIRQDRQEATETFGRKITGQVTKAVADSVPIVAASSKAGQNRSRTWFGTNCTIVANARMPCILTTL